MKKDGDGVWRIVSDASIYLLATDLTGQSARQLAEWKLTETNAALLEKALDTVQRAIVADSTYSTAYAHMSYVLYELGDLQGAMAACEKGIELLGEAPGGDHAWLGRLYAANGEKEKALHNYRESLERDPANRQLYARVRHYMDLGDFTLEEIKGALSLSEEYACFHF